MAVPHVPKTPGVNVEVVEHGTDMHVQRSVIRAGAKIPDHTHRVASSYVVVSGNGRATGDNPREVGPGDVVLVEANEVHGWRAGDSEFVIVGTFPIGMLTSFSAGGGGGGARGSSSGSSGSE